MNDRKPIFSKRCLLKELFSFDDVERVETRAYALSFDAKDKAKELAAVIEKKMQDQGRDIFSIEVFEDPVEAIGLKIPFISGITVVVRSPVKKEQLGALATIAALALTAIIAASLAFLGYVAYDTIRKLEPRDQARILKMAVFAALLLSVGFVAREGRMLLTERG